MRLIIADAYGSGYLDSSEHGRRDLSSTEWTEVDARDTVHGGDEGATVRYRDGAREVPVGANETYQIEYVSDDVIDLRSATTAAEELIAAMDGVGTDEERIYRALETAPHDDTRDQWLDTMQLNFETQAGRSLRAALTDEMSGDELEKALHLLH
jgi:hypothetical protein